eukprot:TRINITY_DN44281_c0_g1_i1.p1 TRINITY_DN44281_c0_g1~~TRINITY_DN44281_c0_g1_i1.p1  ORF type:complete len:344 (+),score=60.85 TRINITY_DN44281_c0_g1_i1:96-1127(+)
MAAQRSRFAVAFLAVGFPRRSIRVAPLCGRLHLASVSSEASDVSSRASPSPPRKKWKIRIPEHIVEMPPVASADPSTMGLGQLIRHMREAAIVWRIVHPPFWAAAFGRLRKLRDKIKGPEAAKLFPVFQHLRLVDIEIVEHCEKVLMGREAGAADGSEEGDGSVATSSEVLDVRSSDLVDAVEALTVMQRPEAAAAALGPLVGRAHRLEPELILRMLTAAHGVSPGTAVAFSDAAGRSMVERDTMPLPTLLSVVEACVALMSEGRCKTGSRTGFDRLMRHMFRRVRDLPEGVAGLDAAESGRLMDAAESAGYATPALRRLLAGEDDTAVKSERALASEVVAPN